MPAHPARLVVFSDLHCPYAYLAMWRLRQVLPEYEGRVEVAHRALAIEYVDEKVTPRRILQAESDLVLLEAPEIPYVPWPAPESEWPVTMWPAFEAVKCAELQGWRQAHELDWRLREAFWARGACISMRHVILRVARGVKGLSQRRFGEDFDSGVAKGRVIDEAREGWDKLQLEVSPTFLLPSGETLANPAGPKVELDEARNHRVVRHERPDLRGRHALDLYRDVLDSCVAG